MEDYELGKTALKNRDLPVPTGVTVFFAIIDFSVSGDRNNLVFAGQADKIVHPCDLASD